MFRSRVLSIDTDREVVVATRRSCGGSCVQGYSNTPTNSLLSLEYSPLSIHLLCHVFISFSRYHQIDCPSSQVSRNVESLGQTSCCSQIPRHSTGYKRSRGSDPSLKGFRTPQTFAQDGRDAGKRRAQAVSATIGVLFVRYV